MPSDRETAIGLLVSQLIRPSGLYKQTCKWCSNEITTSRQAPLTNRMIVVVEGETLLDTIWYHIATTSMLGSLVVDAPFWDREMSKRKEYQDYCSKSYFGHLMPLPFNFFIDGNEAWIFDQIATYHN